MASRLLGAVVSAGGSRHVVAATAAAMWRLCLEPATSASADGFAVDEVTAEAAVRLQAVLPQLEAEIVAGAKGERVPAGGDLRAARNVGLHWRMGAGATAIAEGLVKAKQVQRGGRARRASPQHEQKIETTAEVTPMKPKRTDGGSQRAILRAWSFQRTQSNVSTSQI